MKIINIQTQKQVLAPVMQQSIEILLLPVLDLRAAIDQELQANPLLEADETSQADEQKLLLKEINDRLLRSADNRRETLQSTTGDGDHEDLAEERPIKQEETLEAALLRQLRVEISPQLERQIGELIIGNLDEDGYLLISCEEIADLLELQDLNVVEKVLKKIQGFDPLGIAARDLKECLLIQAEERFNGKLPLLSKIISYHLPLLGHKKYPEIARKLKVTPEQVSEAAGLIAQLDPRPARNFRPLNPHIYIKPDVTVIEEEDGAFRVQVNKENLPTLRINPIYKKMLKNRRMTPGEKAFIKEKIQSAMVFIKSIEQRGETLRAICDFLAERQKAFLRNGYQHLVPMSLKDVAQAVDRNESTVSRAINDKYIDTPQGIYPMKFFFSQAVGQNGKDNPAVSNRSLKEEIRELVEGEDPSSPLSDIDIQRHFEKKGLKIARRTVTKYRQALGILPSHQRKD